MGRQEKKLNFVLMTWFVSLTGVILEFGVILMDHMHQIWITKEIQTFFGLRMTILMTILIMLIMMVIVALLLIMMVMILNLKVTILMIIMPPWPSFVLLMMVFMLTPSWTKLT